MLTLFRTNQTAYGLLLLLYALLLRGAYFLHGYPADAANDGIFSEVTKWLLGENYILTGVVTVLIVFLQSLLINNLCNRYRLFKEVTLFPGLFYVLFVSAVQDFLPLSSVLLGNTFLILAIDNLFSIFKTDKCADAIFNVGWWIGLAALFYNAFIFFFLLAIVGLMVLRNFRFKEVLMMSSGYALPFIFTTAYYFWQDELVNFWQEQVVNQFGFIDFHLEDNGYLNYKLGLLGILFLMGFFNQYTFEKSYRTRSFIYVFYTTLTISGLTFLFQDNIQVSHFLIIAVPLSILLTARFLKFKKTTAELIHILLFVGIILIQFQIFPRL